MRRHISAAVVAASFVVATLALGVPAGANGLGHQHTALDDQFVQTRGTQFTLGGTTFPVVGSNNYYPMYSPQPMVDALFEKASASGFNTMRVWGFFAIGSPGGGDKATIADGDKGVYFQYWDDAAGAPAFNDGANGLERLDYVVYKAKQEGLRLILPLTNNWTAFGGIDQYNLWGDATYHDDFYTDPQIRGWYQDYVDHLLNRVNTYTGVAYKDEPAIMTWELANEPRCLGNGGPAGGGWGSGLFPASADCTPDRITGWVEEMSAYIKSIDGNHLVSVGDEGFLNQANGVDWLHQGPDGVDSYAWAAVPTVDYMSYHLYPDHWGTDAAWGEAWIIEHNKLATQLHKPALLGEFGWLDKSTRNVVYKRWLDASLGSGGAGSLYWILSDNREDGTLYPDYDGFTVYCPSPVCLTFQNYGAQLHAPSHGTFAPVADHDAIEVDFGATAAVNVVANDVAYKTLIVPGTVDLDPSTTAIEASVAVAGGTASASGGVVTVLPDEGFSGQISVPYTVEDKRHKTSNVAVLTVTVKPDPNAALVIEDFAADADGWGCFGGASVTSVGGVGQFANGTGGWDWCLLTLPASLDLSDKDVFQFDFLGTDSGVNPEIVFQVGGSWEWCQISLDTGIWNTPMVGDSGPKVTLSRFSGSCAAGLNDVHTIGIGMQAGTHQFDNLRAN